MGHKTKKLETKSNFLIQGSILAIASLISRFIGMLYRIPMINIIGDEGMSYYSAAYNIYSILLLLSSYSLPLAVSKVIVSKITLKEYKNAYKVFQAAMMFGFVVGAVFGLILFFGANFFANSVLKLPLAAVALRTLAPTIFIMALLGVFRGFFQGLNTKIPTAASQIVEQIINAIISVAAAALLFTYGTKKSITALPQVAAELPNAYGAAGGTIGTGAGALAALVLCIAIFSSYKRTLSKLMRKDNTKKLEEYSTIIRIVFYTAVPVILSTAVYNIIRVLDNSIYGNFMTSIGAGDVYKTTYGVYSGKYLLLIDLPVGIASALASSCIPSITQAVTKNDRELIVFRVNMAIRFAMLIAIPCTVGLAVIPNTVIHALFSSDKSNASVMLMIGSLAVAFTSLSTVTNAILQGIDKMKIPIRNAIISLIIHIVVLVILLWGVNLGIYALIVSNIVFAISMCTLNSMSIEKYLDTTQEIKYTFITPAISAVVMGFIVFFLDRIIRKITQSYLISVLVCVIVGAAVYAVCLIILKTFNERELRALPGGAKIVSFVDGIGFLRK